MNNKKIVDKFITDIDRFKEIEKNNELFANALALKILGDHKMRKILQSQMEPLRAIKLLKIYSDFLLDYENKLNKF